MSDRIEHGKGVSICRVCSTREPSRRLPSDQPSTTEKMSLARRKARKGKEHTRRRRKTDEFLYSSSAWRAWRESLLLSSRRRSRFEVRRSDHQGWQRTVKRCANGAKQLGFAEGKPFVVRHRLQHRLDELFFARGRELIESAEGNIERGHPLRRQGVRGAHTRIQEMHPSLVRAP